MSGSIGSNQEPKDMEQDVDSNGYRSDDENEHAAEPESRQENEESIGNATVSMEEGLSNVGMESTSEIQQSFQNPNGVLPDFKAQTASRSHLVELGESVCFHETREIESHVDGQINIEGTEIHDDQLPSYKDQVSSQSTMVEQGNDDQGDKDTMFGSSESLPVASILGSTEAMPSQAETNFLEAQVAGIGSSIDNNDQGITIHDGEAYMYSPPTDLMAILKKHARLIATVASLMFVLFAVILFVSVYCVSGHCGSNSDNQSSMVNRTDAIRAYINEITLSRKQISYPPLLERETAEEYALEWLIKSDPLQLSTDSASGRFHLKQRYALLTLWYQAKQILNDLDWLSMENEDECLWKGVSCKSLNIKDAGAQNAVTSLNLHVKEDDDDFEYWKQMIDSLNQTYSPTDFPTYYPTPTQDDLSQYQSLDAIPNDIGLLNTLEVLDLFGRRLGRAIPMEIVLLSNLQHLSIGDTYQEGSIPSSIFQLTKLTWLDVKNIGASDPLPSSWEKLSQLQVLDLSSPNSYYPMSQTETIPDSIWTLSNLKQLKLSGRMNFGKISSMVGNVMKSLEVLDLSYTNIYGTIPDSMRSLSNLTKLSLYQTALSGTLPSFIFDMPSLESLEVSTIRLNGTIPESLFRIWPKMKHLALSGMGLSGTLPVSIGNMTSIKYLDFSSNQLHGTIPASISNLIHIHMLDLSNNTLSGLLPSSLDKMESMIYLSFSHNNLRGAIPLFYSRLKYLFEIDVSSNMFSGELPELPRGLYLNFSNNNLVGNFPPVTQQLQFVDSLDLSNNNFSGILPPSIGIMTQLSSFLVSNNQFSGTIPESIFTRYLYEADLSNNNFSGTLPPSIGIGTQLHSFLVSNNQFSGTIPESIFNSSLNEADFSNNNFTGTIPEAVCKGLDSFDTPAIKVDCDEVSCTCCSNCYA